MSTIGVGVLLGLICHEIVTRLGLSKRLLREVATLFTRLDLAAVSWVRKARPPRYAIVGACQRRGACCTQIVADPPRVVKQTPVLFHAFAGFHKLLHNFSLVGRGPDGQLVFRCGFLRADGRCGIYRLRPRLCRTYPLLPFFDAPKILPGCGYRVVLRGLGAHAGLPIVEPHVGTHHPTPPTRDDDHALEHAEDFILVGPPPPAGAAPATPAA